MISSHPMQATMVSLARLAAGYNPRRYFDRRKHDELVESLRLRGMLQPVLVRPAQDGDDRYSIIAGGRRYRAAIEAFGPDGLVPVIIRDMSEQEALEAAIDENDVRDDASETEQADAAVRVLAACQNDRGEAVRRLGWSRAKLDRRLALASLSQGVKLALDERRIKVGHAELLAAVPADKQDKALETILAAGLDIAKTRDLLMRVTLSLADACFDRTDCTICPFNSGTQRALFETHVEDGYCTNPGCFELKTQVVEEARLEEERRADAAQPEAEGLDLQEDGQMDATGGSEAAGQRDRQLPAATLPVVDGNQAAAPSSVKKAARTTGSTITAQSIAGRTADLREATWRTALARDLADNAVHAQAAILVAALTGTLSQIKGSTLTSRAALLVNPAFPQLSFKAKIDEICALSGAQAATAICAIGAAYARDVQSFEHVADLARAFDIDICHAWQPDRAFFERYTKDELRFIGQECGLIAHMGEKAFARLLSSKKGDLISGMLNVTGFAWAGRLPSAMTLDGTYGSRTIPVPSAVVSAAPEQTA